MAIAKKITAHDVVLAVDVSVSTVSLVLSGGDRISSATGEWMSVAIKQLGFVRNRQVSTLRGRQNGVIDPIVRDLSTPLYAELMVGPTEALKAQGHMVFLLHGGKDGEQLTQRFAMLFNQGVDDVMIAGAAGNSDDLQQPAAGKGIPVMFVFRASYLDGADTVEPDNMQTAQLLVEHLIRHKHRRIAWLGGQSSSLTRVERVDGYCTTLLEYGLPFHSDWAPECSSSQEQAAEEVTALLRRNPTTSAVVRYNETVIIGAWSGLMKTGRQSGEIGVDRYFEQQASLAGFVDVAEDALDDIPTIWACTPVRGMGYALAECILQRIGHNGDHSRNLTLSARLVVAK